MYSFYPRIIPVLLLKGEGLYKGKKFKNHRYIGDPINAIKIFNDKEVDELVFFDIDATLNNETPNLNKLKEITGECFMPLAFGGGIKSLDLIREILLYGVEKVIINSAAVKDLTLIKNAVKYFGSSTITCAIDYKKDFLGRKRVYIQSGSEKTKLDPFQWAKRLEKIGVGELIINSIEKDGTKEGYDFEYFKIFAEEINIPLVISGGSKGKNDFLESIQNGFNSMAGGACFVFQGKHDAVLITYDK
tara:strand:+ start:3359 stop:4096 length:738 start_codon:yes stop_codon:yes gene_type:complete